MQHKRVFQNANKDLKTHQRTCFLRRIFVFATQTSVLKRKSRSQNTSAHLLSPSRLHLSQKHKYRFHNAYQDLKTHRRTCFLLRGFAYATQMSVSKRKSRSQNTSAYLFSPSRLSRLAERAPPQALPLSPPFA